jgi:hypothetical protein
MTMLYVAAHESGSGPKQTFRLLRRMSAFGGIADIGQTHFGVRPWGRTG